MKHRVLPILIAAGAVSACQLALDLDQFSFVEAPQGVLWFGLANAERQSCSWSRSYQMPPQARETITSASGEGPRIVDDGETVIACRVAATPGTDDVFDVSIEVSSGEVASFAAAGRLSRASGAALQVAFGTAQFSLGSRNCTATVRAVLPGAFWIQNLTCPDLRDASQPGISCTGSGGLIFERCSQ